MGGGLALNQLLVVMDGIDNPPFFKRFFTNRINTLLDGIYIVPRRIRGGSLRLPAPRPARRADLLHRRDERPDRPARPGADPPRPHGPPRLVPHADEAGPARHPRPLHRQGLARRRARHAAAARRDRAHHERLLAGDDRAGHVDGADDRPPLGPRAVRWEDLVEAITTLESGTAVGDRVRARRRAAATAIHEAGHAIAGHAYMTEIESTRLSIRMRGGSLGHHQAREKEERFGRFQSELFARLVWGLGAMAAERVFYGENSSGVGGDVQSATSTRPCDGRLRRDGAAAVPGRAARRRDARSRRASGVLDRFERIGLQIMNRTGSGGPMHGEPDRSASSATRRSDATPRRSSARRTSPRTTSSCTTASGVERIADAVLDAQGDLRRRARRAARGAEDHRPGDRLQRRGSLARAGLRRLPVAASGPAAAGRDADVSEDRRATGPSSTPSRPAPWAAAARRAAPSGPGEPPTGPVSRPSTSRWRSSPARRRGCSSFVSASPRRHPRRRGRQWQPKGSARRRAEADRRPRLAQLHGSRAANELAVALVSAAAGHVARRVRQPGR